MAGPQACELGGAADNNEQTWNSFEKIMKSVEKIMNLIGKIMKLVEKIMKLVEKIMKFTEKSYTGSIVQDIDHIPHYEQGNILTRR
ncbi:hypothetical protein ACUWC3_28435, partial [Klebsiella pneumoniae]|uniref:hypothetical protein n=1 Tax=Klebsiella pneumoniae TaxID=573 RepID=UPI0040559ADD